VVINCLRKSDQSELNKITKLITTSCEIPTNYYITAAEIKEKKNKKEIKRDGGWRDKTLPENEQPKNTFTFSKYYLLMI
jgi:hypothetical protein